MEKGLLNGTLIGAALTILAQPVYADQVINDDLIINGGSACIGWDCSNGENFGFATLRLKENNLRIEFNDTSSTGTNVDWGIRTNDSSNGGGNYFGIAELLNGNVDSDPLIFRIDAGAPELSLHIDDQGNLNLATSTARIINLADPVNDTDATNLRTVNSVVSSKLTPDWLSSTSQAQAKSSGVGSTAIGAGASAKSYDTAIGYKATITADNSTAIGANSQVHSANSVAIGANSGVASGAEGGVAVGENAKVLSGATNSIALGKDSIASEPNTVSVGSPGNERRITNVADGVNSTDAVNKGQLDAVSSRVSANRKNIKINRQRIDENSEAISENSSEINRLQDELETANAGVAAAASLVVMTPSAPGKTTLNLEGASYEGQYGIGFSIAHRLSSPAIGDDFFLNAGISTSSGNTLTRVGGSWEF